MEQLGRKFQKLEVRITEEQENAKKAESGYLLLEAERDRMKIKIIDLEAERDEFRKITKTREASFLNVEDDYKRKFKELKENYASEKRKIIETYESKITAVENYKSKA